MISLQNSVSLVQRIAMLLSRASRARPRIFTPVPTQAGWRVSDENVVEAIAQAIRVRGGVLVPAA